MHSNLRIDEVPTVRAMVAQKLREAIMSGTLKAGQRLVERELCEVTGLSRPSIRVLEADGLVNTVPRRRPMVSTISLEEARQPYAARAVLEDFAARMRPPSRCRSGAPNQQCCVDHVRAAAVAALDMIERTAAKEKAFPPTSA